MTVVDQEQLVDAMILAARGERAVVLVGAGISMLAPSSLPSGNGLRDYVVERLCRSRQTNEFWTALNADIRYSHLLPERSFQRLFEAVNEALYCPLFEALSALSPNSAHQVVGRLADAFVPILTTNFDLLIERCTDAPIIHLHGRLDSPDTMALRIEQVGMGLLPGLLRQCKRILKGKKLFILGYSGRDRDVTDAISAAGPEEIWWADLCQPAGAVKLKDSDVRFCCADLKEVMGAISYRLENGKTGLVASRPVSAAMPLRGLGLSYVESSDSDRFFCIVKLAAETGQFSLCAEACDAAVSCVARQQDMAAFASYAVLANRELGRLGQAERWMDLGLKSVRYATAFLKAPVFNAYGTLQLDLKPPQVIKALVAFRRALKYQQRVCQKPPFRSNEPLVFLSRIYNNIGWAHHLGGDFERAIVAYEESLRLKRRAGDLPGVAFTSANLARVLYAAGQKQRASRWRVRARSRCREFGLLGQEASILRDMAEVAFQDGRARRGSRWLDAAEELVCETEWIVIWQSVRQARAKWTEAGSYIRSTVDR